MGAGISQKIWCDTCCGENWDLVSQWIHEGKATSKSGTLKLVYHCDSCGVLMRPGSSAEAVTFHFECEHVPWEEEFLKFWNGYEAIGGGEEQQARTAEK